MRLLDRYLLRELIVPLGYCLWGFLLLWISSDLFRTLGDFQKQGLVARDISEYYLVKLPEFLVLVLPIALLLAML
ncbi:MAG TPA: LptF/LptG family permease, partial [Verrucomicrobiae bacterium]